MVPIDNLTVRRRVLDQIMVANTRDDSCSWTHGSDGIYQRVERGENSPSAHYYFIRNPSLSDRRKAMKKLSRIGLAETRQIKRPR